MKTITFKVLNILQRETDETHTITPLTLLELLRYEYDLKIDRRTLYSSIEELRDNGYKIESYRKLFPFWGCLNPLMVEAYSGFIMIK